MQFLQFLEKVENNFGTENLQRLINLIDMQNSKKSILQNNVNISHEAIVGAYSSLKPLINYKREKFADDQEYIVFMSQEINKVISGITQELLNFKKVVNEIDNQDYIQDISRKIKNFNEKTLQNIQAIKNNYDNADIKNVNFEEVEEKTATLDAILNTQINNLMNSYEKSVELNNKKTDITNLINLYNQLINDIENFKIYILKNCRSDKKIAQELIDINFNNEHWERLKSINEFIENISKSNLDFYNKINSIKEIESIIDNLTKIKNYNYEYRNLKTNKNKDNNQQNENDVNNNNKPVSDNDNEKILNSSKQKQDDIINSKLVGGGTIFNDIQEARIKASEFIHNHTNTDKENFNIENETPLTKYENADKEKIIFVAGNNKIYVINKRFTDIKLNPASNLIEIGAIKFTIGLGNDEIKEIQIKNGDRTISKIHLTENFDNNKNQKEQSTSKLENNQLYSNATDNQQNNEESSQSNNSQVNETNNNPSTDKNEDKSSSQQENNSSQTETEEKQNDTSQNNSTELPTPGESVNENNSTVNSAPETVQNNNIPPLYKSKYLEEINADYSENVKSIKKNTSSLAGLGAKTFFTTFVILLLTGGLGAIPLASAIPIAIVGGLGLGAFIFAEELFSPILLSSLNRAKKAGSWIANKTKYLNALVFNPAKAKMLKKFAKEKNMVDYYTVLNSKTNPFKQENKNTKPYSTHNATKTASVASINSTIENQNEHVNNNQNQFNVRTPQDFEKLSKEEKKIFLDKYTNHPERYKPGILESITGKKIPEHLRVTRTDLAMRDLKENMTEDEKIANLSEDYFKQFKNNESSTKTNLQRKMEHTPALEKRTNNPVLNNSGLNIKNKEDSDLGVNWYDPHVYNNKQHSSHTSKTSTTKTPSTTNESIKPQEQNQSKSKEEQMQNKTQTETQNNKTTQENKQAESLKHKQQESTLEM